MFTLQHLLPFDEIVIQCHNVPDVDAIASGYAVLCWLREQGKTARLVYGGFAQITKPNISEFVRILDIPIEYIGPQATTLPALAPGAQNPLLLTVDCQYGAGNVAKIESESVAVIDHHLPEDTLPALALVEPYLGSCATVIWRLLKNAGYDLAAHRNVSTALYYGLYTDTNSLSEIFHPVDRDMLESLDFDADTVRWLKNNNLTRAELTIAGNALIESRFHDDLNTTLFMAEPCDPNILGFISDLTMQAEGVHVCVGFARVNDGLKLSIRSCAGEVMANELASFLTQDYGNGGGNREKAGGFMRPPQAAEPFAFLEERLRAYYQSYDKVVAGAGPLPVAGMKRYRKRQVPLGYVPLGEVFPQGTEVLVRTLEGDAAFAVQPGTLLMVGVEGEVYPIAQEKFEKSYRPQQGRFVFPSELQDRHFYAPTAREKLYGKTVDLLPHVRPCVATGQAEVWARPLQKSTKVFAAWYKDGYMFGKPGDWLAVRYDDTSDAYIIAKKIFAHTYEEVAE